MKNYHINEIFYSLQGEGTNTGTPAIFVRFSGCNLRCEFCDTDFSKHTEMTATQILDEMKKYPANFIVLTGGEPALQIDDELIDILHQNEYLIAIETNGTHPLPKGIDWVTLSPKEGSEIVLAEADEVKVVYTGQNVERYRLEIEAECYYLQPCSRMKEGERVDNLKEVIDYCLKNPHWSLSLQTHKLINIQ